MDGDESSTICSEFGLGLPRAAEPLSQFPSRLRMGEAVPGQEDRPACPVHGGRSDGVTMFGQGVEERMRAAVPGLRGFHIIPGAGHWNQQEKPEATNRMLIDWLKGF